MSDLDNDLRRRTLQQHAENLSATPLAFDDVRGKATSIRRRRQLATGLGVAAAIAVIVPTAMFATRGTSSDGQLPPATQPSTATDTNVAVADVDAHHGLEPARPRRQRPADRRSARRPRPGRQRHRTGPDQRGRGALDEGRHSSVEAAGQTFGPYTSSHGFGPQPGRDGGGVGHRRGRRDGLGRRRERAVRAERDRPRRRTRRRGHRHRLLAAGGPVHVLRLGPRLRRQHHRGLHPHQHRRARRRRPRRSAAQRQGRHGRRAAARSHLDRRARPVVVLGRARPGRDGLDSLVGDVQAHPRHVLAERRLRARQRHLRRRHRRRRHRGVRRPHRASCWPTAGTPARAWSSTTAPSGRTRPTSCSPSSRTASGRWSG